MPPRQIKSFSYREFNVVIAENNGAYIGIGRDHDHKEVARLVDIDLKVLEAGIKQALNPLSNDFVDIGGAINLFLRVFPGGFNSEFYQHYEGNYKRETQSFAADHLAEQKLSEAIDAGKFADVAEAAKRCLQKPNLAAKYELMHFSDMVKSEKNHEPFAHGLRDLLYGTDFETAFNKLVKLLEPYDAAKWPIITFFPFFRFPEQHMFMKPEIVKNTAHRLGYELDYQPQPNITSYQSLLGLTDYIANGILELKPADNIDIQSFMYVVAKDGYVAEAISDRENWEASTTK